MKIGNKKDLKQLKKAKLKKPPQNAEENKVKEKNMWNRLAQLNSEFKDIKKAKKEPKKCQKQL